MGNFNRDNRFGDRRSFGRRDFTKPGANRPMFKATCSKCGNECELPFKPSGDRPVFCSRCFEDNRNSDSGANPTRSNYGDNRIFDAVCDKCGSNCKVPFQPTPGKPVFCSKCFEGKNERDTLNTGQYKEQFEALNDKLDKILKILTPVIPVTPIEIISKEKTVKEQKKPKPKKQI